MVVRNSTKKVEEALVRHRQEPEPLAEGELGGSVTMSRALAQSAHGLTLNEARVMMLATRRIDPRKSLRLRQGWLCQGARDGRRVRADGRNGRGRRAERLPLPTRA